MDGFMLTLDALFATDVFWQLLNTVILCFVLSKILYKPVCSLMNKRKERIENQLTSAEQKLEEANKLKFVYENKLKDIEAERNEILHDTRARANERELQIIAEAKKEADALKERAMIDIQREQEKAKDEIKNQIIEISSLMASRFISASIDENEQKRLVDEVIADLGDVKWLN